MLCRKYSHPLLFSIRDPHLAAEQVGKITFMVYKVVLTWMNERKCDEHTETLSLSTLNKLAI